jgi:hypothetical protein
MVAVIKKTHSLSTTLNYNEKKLQHKGAACILAANYPKDLELLNFYDKLHRLEHQANLNERVKANSVHITLNFHEDDKLSKEQLQEIASEYMEKIGFGDQPYLVYEHYDAGHQHAHIVTTNIQADGTRIDMQNIGRNQSEAARKELEIKYNLVKAGERKQEQKNELELRQVHAQKVIYGKSQTTRAITNVLDHVLKHYKFTTLPELNAVLKQYNVIADRGKEGSKMYERKGLVYRVLDKEGKIVGTPIKASAFYNKPTIKNLEKIFGQNLVQKEELKRHLKREVGWIFYVHKNINLYDFNRQLQKNSISAILRQNQKGFVYGITFVDHKRGTVMNGSDLGKEYGAKAILEKCGLNQNLKWIQKIDLNKHDDSNNNRDNNSNANEEKQAEHLNQGQENSTAKELGRNLERTLDELLHAEQMNDYIPYHLRQDQKQKKKRGLHL